MMQNTINDFIEQKNIAIVGVSRDKTKWGNVLKREFEKLGYQVYAINPNADDIEGEKCLHSISDLPADVDSLVISTKTDFNLELVKEAAKKGIKRVWMQRSTWPGSDGDESINFCKENNIGYVYGMCPMMYFHGKSIHGFHLWLKKVLGRMPKEMKVA